VIARLVVLLLLLAPRAAWACATRVSSAYGDRTFNWAFLGLILMPFVVATGIAGVFAAKYYAPSWRSRSSGSAVEGPAQLAPHEESSL
jgi:transcription elongation factor